MMARESNTLDPNLEFAIMRFWAAGMDIAEKFSRAEIMFVPALAAAIEAVKILPTLIGRDDDEPQALDQEPRAT